MADALPQVINKADITAKVGLGHMTGQQKIAAAQSLIAMMTSFANDPNTPLPIPPMAKLQMAYEMAKGWGYDNPELLFGTPEEVLAETQKVEQQRADDFCNSSKSNASSTATSSISSTVIRYAITDGCARVCSQRAD